MKKIIFLLSLMFLTFFINVPANAKTLNLYTSYISIIGSRGLTKKITIIAAHKQRAEIIFNNTPNFKKQFTSFLKKTTYLFNKYGEINYVQLFHINHSKSQTILISLPYFHKNKPYIENIFVSPDGTYSINKKFDDIFFRYIQVKKTRKIIYIRQFKKDVIVVQFRPFASVLVYANKKVIAAYLPLVSAYFVHNEHNAASKKYFSDLKERWTKQEKRFLRANHL